MFLKKVEIHQDYSQVTHVNVNIIIVLLLLWWLLFVISCVAVFM